MKYEKSYLSKDLKYNFLRKSFHGFTEGMLRHFLLRKKVVMQNM
jgi:hypothetical protein